MTQDGAGGFNDLLINTMESSGWMRLSLEGRYSNASALGAEAFLRTEDTAAQLRYLEAASGDDLRFNKHPQVCPILHQHSSPS